MTNKELDTKLDTVLKKYKTSTDIANILLGLNVVLLTLLIVVTQLPH
jgi:hypothetical protein